MRAVVFLSTFSSFAFSTQNLADLLLKLEKQEPASDEISFPPGPECKLPTSFPKFTELSNPREMPSHPNGSEIELACIGGRELAGSSEKLLMQCKDGYFQLTQHSECVFASPCGDPVKEGNNSNYSGIHNQEKGYLYHCNPDFSLSGQDGGTFSNPSNREFYVQCQANGSFSDFSQTCKPVEVKVAQAYHTLFEVLFAVDCQNGVVYPSQVGASNGADYGKKMCRGLEGNRKQECEGMGAKLDADLKANWSRKEGIAEAFCAEMWTKFVADEKLKGQV